MSRANQRKYLPGTALELSLLLGLVLTGCTGTPAVPSGKPVPESRDEFLDLGQGRVHFHIIRGASPTILLECGGGSNWGQWKKLQPEIARATGLTVISYDRPGFGDSQLPSLAYDPAVEMRQLHGGLKRLGVDRQLILVGHSYGALLNQLYASKYPRTIRGVVLIDPNSVAFMDSIGGARVLNAEVPDRMPEPVEANKRIIAGFERAIEVFRPTTFPADIPIVIITAGKPWWPTEERNKLFRASHEGIVGDNRNRSLVVAEGSGHVVTTDRPDVVLSAITNVISKTQKHHSQ